MGLTMHARVSIAAVLGLICVVRAAAGAEPLVVEIWPGKVPNENGGIGPERIRMSPKLDRKQVEVTEPTRLITAVTNPAISLYRPPKDKEVGSEEVEHP